MLLLWSRRTIITLEIPNLERYIETLKASKEEVNPKLIEHYQNLVENAKEELKIVSEKFTEKKKFILKSAAEATTKD